MDGEGRSCYPTQEQLEIEMSVTHKTIRVHMQKCIDFGFIKKYSRSLPHQKYWNYGYIAIIPEV
jgi:hypothetical protein